MPKSDPISVRILTRLEPAVMRLRNHIGYKRLIIALVSAVSALSFYFSYEIRFDFHVPETYSVYQWALTPFVMLIKTVLFTALRCHSVSWRYAGLRDAERLFVFNFLATMILWALFYLEGFTMVPRSTLLIDFFMCSLMISGLQIGLRVLRERLMAASKPDSSARKKHAIIFGAGDAGEMIVRDILRNRNSGLIVKAFFDDDPRKMGVMIHNITVEGNLEAVPHYVGEHHIDMAIVAIPSANKEQMKRIHDGLSGLDITIKTLPPLAEFIHGSPTLAQLRDINIADLLGRQEISINDEQIKGMILGKIVLVTGAGGSIGSELCRQVLQRLPERLLLMDRSENGLFNLQRKLLELDIKADIVPILCDITDERRISEEFKKHKPNIVFHAAAHKHVPLQELNPAECFKNNVGGTYSIAKAADAYGVELFVMISTDKAVNPTSVMGATKRVCEILCQAFSRTGNTKFISVRFGNVLGSEGSVVPIFLEQIARGGPITITHPEMRRYFMTIPEAVSLVLQSAAIGESGQVLLLDMGRPVKIVDLAHQLLHLLGESPANIPIEFVGLRPGEKLFEELSLSGEEFLKSSHESIWIFKLGDKGSEEAAAIEKALKTVHEQPLASSEIMDFLMRMVPEYDRTQRHREDMSPEEISEKRRRTA